MPRLQEVTPEAATGSTKEIYDDLTQKMGKVINIFRGMGNSSAALQAYLSMSGALSQGQLSPEDREAVYLAVSEQNACHYCVSAHTMIAQRNGMSEDAVLAARQFKADGKIQSLLDFVHNVIETKGFVKDEDLAAVRDAGYSDGQIAESIGYIALATFSNFFNHVYGTPLDFPPAPELP